MVFVLATTEPHKIPETIISRCQRFDFRRPQVRDIAALLASIVERENERPDEERGGPRVEIQDAALAEIARHSQGGFRDAIGTLEKLITYSDGAIHVADVLEALGVTDTDLLFEITDIVADRRPAEALQFVQRLANEGADYSQFIRDLLRHLRQLFLLQHLEESARDAAVLRALGQTVELDEQLLERLLPQANSMAPREVVHFIETLGEAQREIRDGLDAAAAARARPGQGHAAAAGPLRGRPRGAPAAPGGGRGRARPRGRRSAGPGRAPSQPAAPATAAAETPPGSAGTTAAAPAAARWRRTPRGDADARGRRRRRRRPRRRARRRPPRLPRRQPPAAKRPQGPTSPSTACAAPGS